MEPQKKPLSGAEKIMIALGIIQIIIEFCNCLRTKIKLKTERGDAPSFGVF